MSYFQQTLQETAMCAGVGVHLGERALLRVHPAPENHGIRFCRTDIVGGAKRPIRACARSVTGLMLGTTLTNETGDSVATVEHLMAACLGMGLDNLLIEIDGPEVPIMDGSSAVFCDLFKEAGIAVQDAPRKLLRVLKPVEVQGEGKWARISPCASDALSLSAKIDFENPVIGVQQASLSLTSGAFGKDIAFARTFGFYHEVDALQKQGFARGGSLDNAVIIHEDRVVNPGGLRCSDEFIRHKLLDAVGDMALAGAPIAGRYEAERPGHALNNALVRKLLDMPDAWRLEEAKPASERAVPLTAPAPV